MLTHLDSQHTQSTWIFSKNMCMCNNGVDVECHDHDDWIRISE